MSRAKIIKQLKEKNPYLNISELNLFLDFFCEGIKNAIINNKRVELRGFGIFFLKKIKENYSARNPKTGELIYTPDKKRLKFKASKNLKKKIND